MDTCRDFVERLRARCSPHSYYRVAKVLGVGAQVAGAPPSVEAGSVLHNAWQATHYATRRRRWPGTCRWFGMMTKTTVWAAAVAAASLEIGCMSLATRHGPHPEQEDWQRASLIEAVHHGGGTSAATSASTCYYRTAGADDMYQIPGFAHPHCPPAVLIDVNSYRLNINPLTVGYSFRYKVLSE